MDQVEISRNAGTERVQVACPARPGEVRRAMTRLFRDLGLVEDRPSVRLAGLSRHC